MTNDAIFNRIWQKVKKYDLSFISSNGGTGKTCTFKFYLLRDAIEKDIPFVIFCRFGNVRRITAETFLAIKDSYSKRKRRLLSRCEIKAEDQDKFVFIVDKKTGKRIAQVIDIYGQSFYKPFGNIIGAKRAIFDEVLAEDGHYCPDELNKFNRLVNTLARGNRMQILCLYNNTRPDFPYFKFYGGKSYSTHVSESGALFVYFTANIWGHTDDELDPTSIQAIIKKTDYDSVYSRNSFLRYPVFYDPKDLRGAETLCKVEIATRIFKLRYKDGHVWLDERYARKPSKHDVYTVNDRDNSTLPYMPDELRGTLCDYINAGRIKTNKLDDTIFVKTFCERL